MHIIKIFFLTILSCVFCSFLLSCNDNGDNCTIPDVIGNFQGTDECNANSTIINMTISQDDDRLNIEADNGIVWTTSLDGCMTEPFEDTFLLFENLVTINYSLSFNGDLLTFVNTTTNNNDSQTCVINLIKQ